VTSEGVGSKQGSVDVVDLVSLTKVGTALAGPQAGGVEIWKVAP
jgi:hypothetical protein